MASIETLKNIGATASKFIERAKAYPERKRAAKQQQRIAVATQEISGFYRYCEREELTGVLVGESLRNPTDMRSPLIYGLLGEGLMAGFKREHADHYLKGIEDPAIRTDIERKALESARTFWIKTLEQQDRLHPYQVFLGKMRLASLNHQLGIEETEKSPKT